MITTSRGSWGDPLSPRQLLCESSSGTLRVLTGVSAGPSKVLCANECRICRNSTACYFFHKTNSSETLTFLQFDYGGEGDDDNSISN